jgi:ribosomal protein S18 acetylase RimI-like enzyme
VNMHLTKPTDISLSEMMTWFSSEEEFSIWSGPNFRFPFNFSSFKKDLKLDELQSFFLISDDSDLLAFGQYSLRVNRCHLIRLIVNPSFRRQGIASTLIEQLSSLGKLNLNTNSCSLFVLEHNISAITAYEKVGFLMGKYPEKIPFKNCLYMVKG